MKVRIRVTHSTEREIPVYKYELEQQAEYSRKPERFVNTGRVIRTDTFVREKVLFSGSEAAFDIWKVRHFLPADAKIERKVRLND